MPAPMPQITSEDQLLDEETRRLIIINFETDKNQRRKSEAFKGYECLKDHTANYVMLNLLNQFDPATVREMYYSIANISILRKVIDKLAKVYSSGVKRTIGDSEETTAELETAAKELGLNQAMRKTDRYYRTFKNTLLYIRPQKEENGKYCIELEVKAPFRYDVVENPDNYKKPLAVILSDYVPTRETLYYLGDAAHAGREGNTRIAKADENIGTITQAYKPPSGQIQDDGKDNDKREFVWWTKKYHFTTNAKGKIIPGKTDEEQKNPIGELPFVNFAGDQEDCFWADGGSDLIDAGVKINTMITNADHIGVSQGFGQLFMTGKNLPRSVKVGPNHCVQLEYDKEDPEPKIGFLGSNPPLTSLKEQIEMAVALMLSTNNLSRASFNTSLSSGKDFASGVALMIDRSESIEDINEQAQIFIEKEPEVWNVIGLWFDYYGSKQLLVDNLQTLKLPVKDLEKVQVTFEEPQPIQSEAENLANLQLRKNLGLNTDVELIMKDNPGMTEEDAQKKLDKIKAEKKANQAEMGLGPDGQPMNGGGDGTQVQKSGGVQDKNSGGPGFGAKQKAPAGNSDQNQA